MRRIPYGRRRVALWLTPALVAFAGGSAVASVVSPAEPEIALPGCETPADLAPELRAAARLARQCGDDGTCWRAGVARALAARDRFATVYDAHRSYLLAVRAAGRSLGDDAVAPVRAEYATLAAAHPDHPAYAHLLAQLALDGDAYRTELDRIVRRWPDYPWVQLSIAFRARGEASPETRLAARAGYDRFAALCPTRVADRAAALEVLADPEAWRRDGAGLKAAARAAGDRDALVRLWGLEVRFAPVADREAARAAVAAEILEQAGRTDLGADDLRSLLRGVELTGDPALAPPLEDRLLAIEPCADDSTAIRARRREQDPSWRAGDAGAAAVAARRAAIDAALALCPRDESALLQRLELLGGSPVADPAELLATLDRYLALPPARLPRDAEARFLATSYLRWGLRLERVPDLLREDVARIEAAYERARAAGDPLAERRAGFLRRENARLGVRAALAADDVAGARRLVDELAVATAVAPRGGRDPALPGATRLPDERTELDELRARTLTAEGRPVEALAVLERPLLDAAVGPRVEATARAAWRAAHGDETGFASWRERTAAGLPPAPWSAVDREMPAAPLADFGGGSFEWAKLRGRTLLVGIWTGWCTACGGQIEAMNRVAEAIGERRDLAVVGVHADRTAGEAIPFVAGHDLAFEVLMGGDVLFDLGLAGVPTTWIVGPEGRIVRERTGFAGDPGVWAGEALAELEAAAAAAPPAAER